MGVKYKVNSVVLGYVTGIKEYGIFVQLDNNTSGLIHISEISNKFIKNINNYAYVGELIRVRIIDLNEDNHYSLSTVGLDYRITKNKKGRINETPSGFKNLAIFLEKILRLKKNKSIFEKVLTII